MYTVIKNNLRNIDNKKDQSQCYRIIKSKSNVYVVQHICSHLEWAVICNNKVLRKGVR